MQGRLSGRDLEFTIHTQCADSGRLMEIGVDSDLNIGRVTNGADPMFSMPPLNTEKVKEKSIIDVF